MWNLTNDLKEIVNTNLPEQVLNIDSLNSGEEHVQEYEIKKLTKPSLMVDEIFDTGRDTENIVNKSFLFQSANKCSIKLTLTNNIDKPIQDIRLKRLMPEFLKGIEFQPPNLGDANIVKENGENYLSWIIESLDANKMAELYVTCTVTMNETSEQHLGGLDITYLIDNHQLMNFNPEVRSLTESMNSMTNDEGSSPQNWDCSIEFINDSEFKIRVEEIRVNQ